MAHSVTCHGYSTMVLNLFLSDREELEAPADAEPWLAEYTHGMGMEVPTVLASALVPQLTGLHLS